jgi:cold shock CspA family protein
MGRSAETFRKKELEKQKLRQRQDKAEKMQERRAAAKKGRNPDDMIAYLDEDGNLSSTPPDPRMKKVFAMEDIRIQTPRAEDREEANTVKTGVVTYFSLSKGYGFVRDSQTGESAFVHVNQLSQQLKENDRVEYETEQGHKGLNAVNVKKAG